MIQKLANQFKREEGQGLIEYALLLCLIVIVVIGAVFYFFESLTYVFHHVVYWLNYWCACF